MRAAGGALGRLSGPLGRAVVPKPVAGALSTANAWSGELGGLMATLWFIEQSAALARWLAGGDRPSAAPRRRESFADTAWHPAYAHAAAPVYL